MEDVMKKFFKHIVLLEVKKMSDDFREIYTKDGKDLTSLVQEWINENIENITCKCRQIELQCRQNR